MKFKKRSGILISKEYEHRKFYIKIKEFLERNTKQYNSTTYILNKFYIESERFLLIPRNFPLQQFIFDYEIEDIRHEGQPIDINHHIQLRSDTQINAVNYLMNNESGILQLAPGVGKTVITIYMIATRKLKTLVVAHRDSLVDQWIDRFLGFTDLKKEDIVRLSSSTFKEDLKKSIIVSTTQTFTSLLRKQREEFLIALNEANVGIFVADEVHTSVGAPTFSECSIHMPSKYTYGLSATPYRSDGNEDVIKFHLGEIFSDSDTSGTLPAFVKVILIDYNIDTPKRHYYMHFNGDFQRSRYLNMIRTSSPFIATVKGILERLLKEDRHTICIVERIKLIDELFNWMPGTDKSKFCGTANAETMKNKTTFATSGKCRDGIDAPWKDALIITSPISNIEQLSGRVTRSMKDKKVPLIFDMVDYGCKEIRSTYLRRQQFYKQKGWNVNYILVSEKGNVELTEHEALVIIKGENS